MTIEHWLVSACADVERRNLPGLKPLLTSLSEAMQVLRDADWNDRADGVETRARGFTDHKTLESGPPVPGSNPANSGSDGPGDDDGGER
jgi:hypothetical protein